MSETNNGDAATLSAVENISGDQVAAMFMQSEEVPEAEVEVTESPTSQEEVTEPVEVEAQAEVEAPDENSEEVAEEESEPVLSNEEDKPNDRMQKRIDKLTAEKYALTDRLDAIESKMLDKQKEADNKGKKLADLVSNTESFEDLEQYEKEAREAKRFALQHVGKEEIEFQGNTYSDDQIRQILLNAEDVLDSLPARRTSLTQRSENEKVALETWEDFSDPESSLAKWYDTVSADKEVSEVMGKLPNKRYILGLIYEGQLALEARNAPQPEKGEEQKIEKVAEVKKPAAIPTSVPGMNSSPAPGTKSANQSFSEERSRLTSTNLSGDSLAALLDKQYHQIK